MHFYEDVSMKSLVHFVFRNERLFEMLGARAIFRIEAFFLKSIRATAAQRYMSVDELAHVLVPHA